MTGTGQLEMPAPAFPVPLAATLAELRAGIQADYGKCPVPQEVAP